MYRNLLAIGVLLNAVGCSSLGLSISPPRNLLTSQAESVVDRAPRNVSLPRELQKTVLSAHYLQPGDVLLVEPAALDAEVRLPADQKVLVDGTIDLGEFGRVIVAGLTLESAESLIERTIVEAGAEATEVNVRLLEHVHRIYVLGEVASPGSYPFTGNETVLDGILAAGGLTSQADACRVVLARPTAPPSCRVALPICYREITQLGDTTTNYQLQPGDRIFVASRSWCEDLYFWKAKDTCDRCCRCQVPCGDPMVASYRNPITDVLPAPPVMTQREVASQASEGMSAGRASEPGLLEDDSALPEIDLPEARPSEALPLPNIRRMTPPGEATPPTTPAPQGQLQFDPPLPSSD